ncbi:MAG: VanZ family protein [Rhodothermaceae bacterium]
MKELIKSVKRKSLLLILSVYWGIIFIGTSLPGKSLKYIPQYSDKLKHFAAYLILTILLYWFYLIKNKKNDLTGKQIRFIIILTGGYGILDELHQLLIPGRSCDVVDWLADLAGIFFGLVIAKFWFAKKVINA